MNNTNYDCDEFFSCDLTMQMRYERKEAQEQQTPKKKNNSNSNNTSPRTKTPSAGDRFIPSRGGMDYESVRFALSNENTSNSKDKKRNQEAALLTSPSKEEYKRELADSLAGESRSSKVLAFKNKAPAPREGYQNEMKVLYTANKAASTVVKKPNRNIPQAPERILDAPDLVDDYYLNLLDWSCGNQLAVALGQSVYIWDATSGSVSELFTTEDPDNIITSVSWINEGSNYLAVGTNNAEVQLWDVERQKQMRSMLGHNSRISSLAWNNHLLSSGSRDTLIFNHDVRIPQHHVSTFSGHTQDVCGLKWSPDGTQLASGGNDNVLNIWDAGLYSAPRYQLTDHQAAVKALAWCPWQKNLLASGGGTADRCIKFWNTATGACVNSVDTNSQVCALQWSKTYKELVSSHGFSQNQLTVWKYPSMVRTAELTGHTSRVLHMAISPDGSTVASAAGDETIRFWKVFAPSDSTAAAASGSGSGAAAAKKDAAHTAVRSTSAAFGRSINLR